MNIADSHRSGSPVYRQRSAYVNAYISVKRMLYAICKFFGLFKLARGMARGGLRIISYHGFAMSDEEKFSQATFILPETFRRRLQFMKDAGYPVLDLDRALRLLDAGDLPDCATVITIDDGFYSTYRCACPILERFELPATVYVTSYYAAKEHPVFCLAVQYMFWKTGNSTLDMSGLGIEPATTVSLQSPAEKERVMTELIQFGEERCDEDQRMALAEGLGDRLGIDYRSIAESRAFNIMNFDEIGELARKGIDIQLHTHRHSLPEERDGTVLEIKENRRFLESATRRPLIHFCYPNGFWSQKHLPWLHEAGIISAVTCDRGLNYPGAQKLALKRFGDSEGLSQVEFEAELCGFAELVRSAWAKLSRARGQEHVL